MLGILRRRGRLDVPAVSAITDLAALRFWAHPGVDITLVTHEESIGEVRSIAPETDVRWVRGLTVPGFTQPGDAEAGRRLFDLPDTGRVVVVGRERHWARHVRVEQLDHVVPVHGVTSCG